MIIYCQIYEPLDWGYLFRDTTTTDAGLEVEDEYKTAIYLSLIGCFIGWMALEFMVIGLGITKSALASYGEMAGIVVPFTFDALVLNREFLFTDFIGLALIVLLIAYQAHKSLKNAEAEEKRKQEEAGLLEMVGSEVQDSSDSFKKVAIN